MDGDTTVRAVFSAAADVPGEVAHQSRLPLLDANPMSGPLELDVVQRGTVRLSIVDIGRSSRHTATRTNV